MHAAPLATASRPNGPSFVHHSSPTRSLRVSPLARASGTTAPERKCGPMHGDQPVPIQCPPSPCRSLRGGGRGKRAEDDKPNLDQQQEHTDTPESAGHIPGQMSSAPAPQDAAPDSKDSDHGTELEKGGASNLEHQIGGYSRARVRTRNKSQGHDLQPSRAKKEHYAPTQNSQNSNLARSMEGDQDLVYELVDNHEDRILDPPHLAPHLGTRVDPEAYLEAAITELIITRKENLLKLREARRRRKATRLTPEKIQREA